LESGNCPGADGRKGGNDDRGSYTYAMGGTLQGGWRYDVPLSATDSLHTTDVAVSWLNSGVVLVQAEIALVAPDGTYESLILSYPASASGCPSPAPLVQTAIGPAYQIGGIFCQRISDGGTGWTCRSQAQTTAYLSVSASGQARTFTVYVPQAVTGNP
jgi:hypothetical protein